MLLPRCPSSSVKFAHSENSSAQSLGEYRDDDNILFPWLVGLVLLVYSAFSYVTLLLFGNYITTRLSYCLSYLLAY